MNQQLSNQELYSDLSIQDFTNRHLDRVSSDVKSNISLLHIIRHSILAAKKQHEALDFIALDEILQSYGLSEKSSQKTLMALGTVFDDLGSITFYDLELLEQSFISQHYVDAFRNSRDINE